MGFVWLVGVCLCSALLERTNKKNREGREDKVKPEWWKRNRKEKYYRTEQRKRKERKGKKTREREEKEREQQQEGETKGEKKERNKKEK